MGPNQDDALNYPAHYDLSSNILFFAYNSSYDLEGSFDHGIQNL